MATKRDLLKLIRANCSECMGGPRACAGVWPIPNPSEIEGCTSEECAFYKYRLGKDPHKNPARVLAAKRLQKYRQLKPVRNNIKI